MKRILKVLWAHIRANVFCLCSFPPRFCVFTRCIKAPGYIFSKTTDIEVGTGSIFKGTWKTERVFYGRKYEKEDEENWTKKE